MADAIFIGLSTVDLIYAVDEFPEPNSKINALSQEVFVGGPATNAAVTFAHLGGKASLVTAGGSHALATAIKAEARQHAVNLIDLNPGFTGVPVISSIAVNKRGERDVVSANALRVDVPSVKIDEAALAKAALAMVDGHYMQACQAWAEAARARGIPVVLDGGSWKEGTADLLYLIHTAICSNDFMPPGCSSEVDVIDYLKESGVANTILVQFGCELVCDAFLKMCGLVDGTGMRSPRAPTVGKYVRMRQKVCDWVVSRYSRFAVHVSNHAEPTLQV